MLKNANDELMVLGVKEDGKPLNAFIIDDSIAMIKIVTRTLKDFGLNVIGSAKNGEEALKLLAEINEPVDLVTLDITMPIKDGLTTLPEIVEGYPNTKIIMVSALGDKNRVIQAMQMGASYYIVKPFRKETFYMVLRRVFK